MFHTAVLVARWPCNMLCETAPFVAFWASPRCFGFRLLGSSLVYSIFFCSFFSVDAVAFLVFLFPFPLSSGCYGDMRRFDSVRFGYAFRLALRR